MTEPDDINWSELADVFKENHRPHAGHFSWETDRALAEQGVAIEFVAELERSGRSFFAKWRHRGVNNDPPDCEAIDTNGDRVAIEITELVDGASAAAARGGFAYEPRLWADDLGPYIQGLIDRKDSALLRDPPYSQYVLLIFSDEPGLTADAVRNLSIAREFHAVKITRVFVLLSYDAWSKTYPCFELRLAPNSASDC